MAESHHHQLHHMNNIHRPSSSAANLPYAMVDEEEDDLAALRNAALKTLEERKLKKEPRALIVQRNNVIVIEPQDNVIDHHKSPPSRRRSRDVSPSAPTTHRRRSRERSPSPRRISPSARWSPRIPGHRGATSPYHSNGGRHSPSHHAWNSSKRRSSPRPHSPRRRSPVCRRASPFSRKSPHRLQPTSPMRRSPQRGSPVRRSPRKSPGRSSPRRFSPRRRAREPSDSRLNELSRRNGTKRKTLSPSSSQKKRSASPRRREQIWSAGKGENEVQPASRKGRFERFEDSAGSDDESCNESLLDELFKETEESSAHAKAIENGVHDEDSKENAAVIVEAGEDKLEDGDCLLLQAEDDLDDLLADTSVPEPSIVEKSPEERPAVENAINKRDSNEVFKEREHDEKIRNRRHDHRVEPSTEIDSSRSQFRLSQTERTVRVEKKENRERKSKASKRDKAPVKDDGVIKRKRSRSREKYKVKRKSSRKSSPKSERLTNSKIDSKPAAVKTKPTAHSSPERNISIEDRERFEARKKKFLQTTLKPSHKVISLRKSPPNRGDEIEETRRVQDRLGEPVEEIRRRSPVNDNSIEAPSPKSTILSRLGPPPSSRGTIKDRIGHINTNSSSPTRTPAGMDSAQVKFEVRNRPTLDPKLKIHINLGGPLSSGSSSGTSKSKKVVCLE